MNYIFMYMYSIKRCERLKPTKENKSFEWLVNFFILCDVHVYIDNLLWCGFFFLLKTESSVPLSFAGLLPPSSSTSDMSSVTDSKAHKAKKKKKKNKHKHKHKHKHERPEKDLLERIREGSMYSSENSPSVTQTNLSSPEFEIWIDCHVCKEW